MSWEWKKVWEGGSCRQTHLISMNRCESGLGFCLSPDPFLPLQFVQGVCTFSSSSYSLPSWAAGDRHFFKCKVRGFFSAHQMLSGGTRALRKPIRLGGCVQPHSLQVPTPSIPPPTTSLCCDGFPTSPRPRAPAAPSLLLTPLPVLLPSCLWAISTSTSHCSGGGQNLPDAEEEVKTWP